MKRLNFFYSSYWVYLTLLYLCSIGQVGSGQTNPNPPDRPSLLWEISGKNLEKPSYLFGAIHLIGKSQFFMPEAAKERFDLATTLVMEINLDSALTQQKLMQGMMMNGGITIKALLQEDYGKVKQFLHDSLSLDLTTLNTMKPIFVETLALPRIIGEPALSYETYFLNLAREAGKKIVGLETVEEQIQFLNRIPLQEQAQVLLEFVETYSEQKTLYHEMVELYKRQEIDRLYQLILEQPEFERYREILLDARNRAWLPEIKMLIMQEPVFIVVGAGHLPGEQGLIKLLTKVGYRVTPLR